MIAIVDCGMGNTGSILNMLRRTGAAAAVTGRPGDVVRADRIILPGVGAFDAGMERLRAAGLAEALEERAGRGGVPTLGICLGMQLLTRRSEEGSLPGFGWLDADTVRFRFPDDAPLKVPHMGWNEVTPARPHPLFAGLERGARFYFVHSYHVRCDRPEDELARARYGADFTAAFARGNLFGVQFHPEKSHRFGLRLLGNFAAL